MHAKMEKSLPLDTGHKLYVYKTFGGRPGHIFNLRTVSRGYGAFTVNFEYLQ